LRFAFTYILPEHIFNDAYGIGFSEWGTWNPVLNSTHPHVTAGPFILSDFSRREYYSLTKNPDFAFLAEEPPAPETTGTNTLTEPVDEPMSLVVIAARVVSGVSVTIILVMVLSIIRHKETNR
jgi:ABC-type transport system substrate-binding protein